jgi:two-component system OmpR family sensor kinase
MFRRMRWTLRLRIMHIRTQLTILYMLIFVLVISLLSVVFYINLHSSLETNVDTELQEHTTEIAAGIYYKNGKLQVQNVINGFPGLIDSDSGSDSPGGDTTAQVAPTPANSSNNGSPLTLPASVVTGPLVRVLDRSGHTLFQSPAFRQLIVTQASVTQALHGTPWLDTVATASGESVRLYSMPLLYHKSVVGVLQVGESLTSLANTMRNAVIELLTIGALGLLLSFFLGYWLARRAFLPVQKMTSIARRIEASDLHKRVPVPQSKDELHTLALTFNEMIARLEQDFLRQRRFVADASHELRTPVAAIRSMTDVVLNQQNGASPEEYRATVQDINAEVERLGHLINDLLTLARNDEGQAPLEREAIRLDQLALDVAATTEALASEKGITVEVQAEQPATVIGDEVRLIQVMMNLIDNAIAYTNAGGTVRLCVEVKGNFAHLIVSDTGVGIAQEHLAHIFERFYRADAARSRAAGGTGLGLAIVEWIVRAHNGTISVESQVGVGTTFTVQLPLAATPPASMKTPSGTLQKTYKP